MHPLLKLIPLDLLPMLLDLQPPNIEVLQPMCHHPCLPRHPLLKLVPLDLQPKVYSHSLHLRHLLQIFSLKLILPLSNRGLWLLVVHISHLQPGLGYLPHLWLIITLLLLFNTHFKWRLKQQYKSG
jgi:hypothetical protein